MNGSQRRMEVFRELAKLTLKGRLKEKIDAIPGRFWNSPGGITAVKNEVMVAMGLNPVAGENTELSREVDAALKLEEVEFPPVTVNKSICSECSLKEEERECRDACVYDREDRSSAERRPIIDNGKCLSCGRCIPRCPLGAINDKIEFIPMSRFLDSGTPVYATVAPAAAGQFGRNVTMGSSERAQVDRLYRYG